MKNVVKQILINLITFIVSFVFAFLIFSLTPIYEIVYENNLEREYAIKAHDEPYDYVSVHNLGELYKRRGKYKQYLAMKIDFYLHDTTSALAALEVSNAFLLLSEKDKENAAAFRKKAGEYAEKAFAKMIQDDPRFMLSIAHIYSKIGWETEAKAIYTQILSKFKGDSLITEEPGLKRQLISQIQELSK